MNASKIEWCTRTWNPVTGCLHGCEYCYARGICHRFKGDLRWNTIYAQRHDIRTMMNFNGRIVNELAEPVRDGKGKIVAYPFEFEPTLHRYRLGEPAKAKKPQNIFTVDMGDLFGEWVPDEWIREVFAACGAAPWHNYLFLTKNGARYEQLGLLPNHKNFWYGTTRTGTNPKLECGASDHGNTFLSLEPLLAPLDAGTFNSIEFWDWVIIGAMTGLGAAAHQPRREWVETIVKQCREAGVPVFLKNNLADVWGGKLIQEMPERLGKAAGR